MIDQVKLTNAIITSIATSGSNETPAVSVSIAFEKIQMLTHVYLPDGSVGGVESVIYDIRTNQVTEP